MEVSSIQSTQVIQYLKEADQTRNLNLVFQAVIDCVRDYGMSLQQIENTLRENRCWTHLIARKRNESHTDKVEFRIPSGTLKTYFLFISTRDQQEVNREILEESKNYEENFEKLSDTGFQVAKDENTTVLEMFNSGNLEMTDEYLLELISTEKGREQILSMNGGAESIAFLEGRKRQTEANSYKFCLII